MDPKNQYDISFEDFVTKDVLEKCTDLEKEKLKLVYTRVSNIIKKHDSGTVGNFNGIWQIDRDSFLQLIEPEFLEHFYIVLDEVIEEDIFASIMVNDHDVNFSEIYDLHQDDLKMIVDLQDAFKDLKENHNTFEDMILFPEDREDDES